jgi:hypothetical protein
MQPRARKVEQPIDRSVSRYADSERVSLLASDNEKALVVFLAMNGCIIAIPSALLSFLHHVVRAAHQTW